LDSALSIARYTQYYEGISNTAEQISIVYDEEGNTDSALAYFHLYRAGFDSLFSQNNSLNLIIKESEWLVKKQEIENRHLIELSQLQKKQIIFKNALLLAVVILLFLTIVITFFINKSIQAKKKKTEFAFKQKIAESQIQSLRAQMNPHFIFNSLNSIENFMMQNEKRKASDYLHKFALLIRTILDSSRNEITSISLDMEALKLYIDLEQMRFNNKFSYKENIDPQLLSGDYNVPSLLIQPYVENAIVHGIAHSDKPNLKLTVSATLENDYIKYVIEDNGIGRTQAEDYNKINKLHHKSVGLKITEDRIHLFNQNENANGHIKITDIYSADNKPGGTRVEVKIKAI
jgi:LytS/YehU family sensor histidine kinase